MNMILPYHDIATAAALAEASFHATRPQAQIADEHTPMFLSPCGKVTPIHIPSRWSWLVGVVLAPISGPTLSQSRNGASNI